MQTIDGFFNSKKALFPQKNIAWETYQRKKINNFQIDPQKIIIITKKKKKLTIFNVRCGNIIISTTTMQKKSGNIVEKKRKNQDNISHNDVIEFT